MAESGIEGIEEHVDELLALPPEQFTEARNAVAKRLRSDGNRDASDAVKRLPRPSLALWGLNRLAREDGAPIEAFLQAADALREATSSGGDIRAATGPERAAESRVTKAVAALVRAEGRGVTDAVERGIGQTLQAAAADAGVADALRSGRLVREPEAPSLDDVLGFLALAPPTSKPVAAKRATAEPAAAKPAPEPDRRAERRALKEGIAAAAKDAVAAREDARSASDAAREAREQLRRAEKRAEERKRRSDAAEALLADLQAQLDAL